MEVIVQDKPLNPQEQTRLKELETVIRDNFMAYVAVGSALLEIRERRLYRNDDGRTWEGYCRELWDMSHQRADQLIAAKLVVENLTTIVVKDDGKPDWERLPANEAQARELARLAPGEQKQVWRQLIEAKRDPAADDAPLKVTAKAVKNAVKKLKGELITTGLQKALRDVKGKAQPDRHRQSEEYAQAFAHLLEQIEEERRADWKNTSRKVVFESLLHLTRTIGECDDREIRNKKVLWRPANLEKLLADGYKIFRMGRDKMTIEQMESVGTWVLYGEYSTPEEGEAVFKDLLVEGGNLEA